MSLRQLHAPKAFDRPKSYQWEPPSHALARWAETPQAADSETEVSIYDVIGDDGWGGGFSARKMAAILRSLGEKPVTVAINSPGGDMFEGIAIYNLLREHKAEVTIKVRGVAASAASVIAMAGDKIVMGRGSFLMIHNAWGMVIGNRNDFTAAATTFAEFDDAMAGIYEARSGLKRAEIAALMDAETFMSAETAKDRGFADEISDEEPASTAGDPSPANRGRQARNRIDSLLASQGLPRSERRRLLAEIAGKPSAAGSVMPGADDFPADDALALTASINNFIKRI